MVGKQTRGRRHDAQANAALAASLKGNQHRLIVRWSGQDDVVRMVLGDRVGQVVDVVDVGNGAQARAWCCIAECGLNAAGRRCLTNDEHAALHANQPRGRIRQRRKQASHKRNQDC